MGGSESSLERLQTKGKEMISLRFAVPAVVVAAAMAGCITYFAVPAALQAEADLRLPPTMPNLTGRPDAGISNFQRANTEADITAFQQAAAAILKRAQNARASAGPDEPVITRPIPLPKKRPIPRD
jgi:hypothetical protein